MSEDTRNTEIAHLDDILLSDEHILALDVSVQNLAVMHVFQPETNLSKPVQDLIFCEMSSSLLLYQLLQITTISEIHHDTQVSLLCLVDLPERDDIRMIKYLENLRFLHSFLSLSFAHGLYVDLLDYAELLCRLGLHEECLTESTLA